MTSHLLQPQQRLTLEQGLANCNRFVLCAHTAPDGDAVGSTVGFWHYLKALGKEATVILPTPFPENLRWIPGSAEVLIYEEHPEAANRLLEQAEVVVCMDFNELSRLEKMAGAVEQCPARMWMIDHHLNPSGHCEVTVSYPAMSSTCELVFRLIDELGGYDLISNEAAQALYAGMCTDTGGFTYNSTDPAIFYIIGRLLEKGIDKDKIYRQLFFNNRLIQIRLTGYLMNEKLTVYEPYRATLFTLTEEEQQRYGYQKGDTEGVVNTPLTIQGVRLSCSLREDRANNRILVSLRSVDEVPCNRMAAEFFQGGGHLNAAGGKFYGTLDEAVAQFERAIEQYKDILVPVK